MKRLILIPFFFASLVLAQAPPEWTRQFQSAENTFNSREQYASVALFQTLVDQIMAERSKRAFNDQEATILLKSLDYLGQAYFNNNEEDKARGVFAKILTVNPNYKMDEDLVSSKIIELYTGLKRQSLGTIKISSNPKEASIRIDGQFAGSTDLEASSSKGDHVLEISKPGYMPQTKTVTVNPGSTVQLQFDLVVNPEGLRFYKDGVAQLQRLNIKAAQDLLEKAASEQPDYALIHSALAEVWMQLGYGDKAQEEAKKAVDLSQNLPQEDRLLIEARYQESQYNWDKALENYRAFLSSHPDAGDVVLRAAELQIRLGKEKEAAESIERLRMSQKEDPRLELAAAEAAGAMRNYQQQLASSQKAIELGRRMDAQVVMARAWLVQGNALLHTRDFPGAASAFSEASKIYTQLSDQNGIAAAHVGSGDALSAQNQLDKARTNYEEALGVYRQISNKKGVAEALYRLGVLYDQQGDADTAKNRYEEAIQAFRQMRDKRSVAQVLYELGNLRSSQMDRTGAKTALEESLSIYRELNDSVGVAQVLSGLGEVQTDQKDLDAARKSYEEALSVSRQNLDQKSMARALAGLADISREKDPNDAKAKYEEALKTFRAMEDKEYLGRTLYKYGLLLQQIKDNDKAKTSYQEAIVFLREAGDKSYLARAQVSLGEITDQQKLQAITLLQNGYELLSQKDYPAAQRKYEQALTVSRETGDKASQVGALLNLGFLSSNQKDDAGAEKNWNEAQQISHEIGDKKSEAMALWNLSVVAYNRREWDSAKSLYDRSAALFTEVGETPRARPW